MRTTADCHVLRGTTPPKSPLLLAIGAIALSAMLAACPARAQHTEWPVKHHDPQNSSATDVDMGSDYLALDWVVPHADGLGPLLVADTGSGQCVFGGNVVSSAHDGARLLTLPGMKPAIGSGRVFLVSGSTFYAYDLNSLGTLAWNTSSSGDYTTTLTAGNGVMYAIARSCGLKRFDAETGTELWSTPAFPYLPYIPAIVDTTIGGVPYEVALVGSGVTDTRGFPESKKQYSAYAFNTANGQVLWKKWTGTGMFGLSVDPSLRLVFGGEQTADSPKIHAFDVENGDIKWSYTLNFQLNAPPTLGWVQEEGGLTRAVFCVSAVDSIVYAFDAATGRLIWQKDLSPAPEADVHSPGRAVTYAGGRLYFGTYKGYYDNTPVHDPCLYTLDANSGDILEAKSAAVWGQPVVVNTTDAGPRLYTLCTLGENLWGVARFRASPTPPAGMTLTSDTPSIWADGASKATITATLPDTLPGGKVGVEITFTTNLGTLNPQSVLTDSDGKATTTLMAPEGGVAVVNARCTATETAYVLINVQAPPPPPPSTGSIWGYVTDSRGRPVSGADVYADVQNVHTGHAVTATDGSYTMAGLPLGTYSVYAKKGKSVTAVTQAKLDQPGTIVNVNLSF